MKKAGDGATSLHLGKINGRMPRGGFSLNKGSSEAEGLPHLTDKK